MTKRGLSPFPPSPDAGKRGLSPFLSDAAVERLRAIEDRPDFSGTRYEIDEQIGRGGMGIVFRGRDRLLEREVAIKITTLATDADADRLRREARTLACLEHPGVVPIHDVGQLPDGRVFSVMLLVRGERLDQRAGALALADRLRLFDRVCDTLSFAHARGIVHRDLKPANIMVGAHGEVRVLDWGLAGADGGSREVNARAGTSGYMAPESPARGALDPRMDVYALGVILRDLTPAGDTRALRPLHSIVRRAMAIDPAARYPDAASLAADVRSFADGGAVGAHAESPLDKGLRLVRAYRTPIALVLAYLVMRALLLYWPG